jgi:hypothetical protein
MSSRQWWLVALLAGCFNPHDPTTLVRVDQESPGANCQYGGLGVSTGLDNDHNGVLSDSEITSTQYVCNGGVTVRCPSGANVHDGAVVIHSASDFAQLAGITCIDGDLIIAGITGEIPDLNDLQTVTGEVVVAGNADLTTLDGFTALREVGQSYLVQGNDLLDDISSIADLDRVLSVFLVGNNAMHDLSGLSSLNTLPMSLTVANNPALTSLHGLENVFTTKSWLIARGNRSLTDLSALQSLRSAGALELSSNATLASLELPNLEKVDVRLLVNQNPAMTSISLPKLVTLADGLVFNGNTQLVSLSMPALLTTGIITIENDTSLTTIDAHNLAYVTVDLNFTNLSSLTAANFSGLKTVAGTLRVYNASPFAFNSFGSLQSVGNLQLVTAGMTDFTGLSSLATVAGNMTVWGCPQFSSFAGMVAMTDIGGNLLIVDNPMLSAAVAQSFANSVTVHGTVTIQ